MQSVELLHRWHASGVFTHMLNDIEKDDVLVQMNCLDLLTQLASVSYGVEVRTLASHVLTYSLNVV